MTSVSGPAPQQPFVPHNVPAFLSTAKSLGITQVAKETLKGDTKDLVPVNIGEKNIVYYSEGDLQKIQLFFEKHANECRTVLKHAEKMIFDDNFDTQNSQTLLPLVRGLQPQIDSLPHEYKQELQALLDKVEYRLDVFALRDMEGNVPQNISKTDIDTLKEQQAFFEAEYKKFEEVYHMLDEQYEKSSSDTSVKERLFENTRLLADILEIQGLYTSIISEATKKSAHSTEKHKFEPINQKIPEK